MSTLKPLNKPAAKPVRRASGKRVPPKQNSSQLTFIALLAIATVGIVLMVVRARLNSQPAASTVPVSQAARPLNAPTGQTADGYWYKGQADAPVTVEVFGDFQCPSCRAAFQQIEGGIDQQYVETGKIKFVFHDFPLNIHPNAVPAAEAARAAGAQGKFWAMHDLLYARQDEWAAASDPKARFKSYAAELGLDQQAFDQALDSGQYAAPITAAIQDGTKRGVNATPTYYVDGQVANTGALGAAIDAALKAKGR